MTGGHSKGPCKVGLTKNKSNKHCSSSINFAVREWSLTYGGTEVTSIIQKYFFRKKNVKKANSARPS